LQQLDFTPQQADHKKTYRVETRLMRPERPLLLLLATSIALLTTAQSFGSFALITSRAPAVAKVQYWPASNTREEVGDKGIDLSVDARREYAVATLVGAHASEHPDLVDDAESEVSRPRLTMHRRIAPPSPDDAFPSA
jgi:hypothetical protein